MTFPAELDAQIEAAFNDYQDNYPGAEPEDFDQADFAAGFRACLELGVLPWVSVKDRVPTVRGVTRKTPNGILIKFNNGNIRHSNDVTELLVNNMRNGPRQPTKYEAPAPARITHWLDLDAAESGPGGNDEPA